MYKFGVQGRGVGWKPYIEIIYSLYYTVTYFSPAFILKSAFSSQVELPIPFPLPFVHNFFF